MDLKKLGGKLGMAGSPPVLRKAQELERLCKVRFNSSAFGLGEVCKSILCLEMACSQLCVEFDRPAAIRISGLSEKSYTRSLTNLQNALGLRLKVDVRELAIQFGCVRLVVLVQRVLAQYKQRFVASLPETRKGSADFSRPVFTAVAFYLCARRNKLKVDKLRLMEICGTSESEFAMISASMLDLCFDLVGLERERKTTDATRSGSLCSSSSKRKKLHPELSASSELDSVDEELSELLKRSRTSCVAS